VRSARSDRVRGELAARRRSRRRGPRRLGRWRWRDRRAGRGGWGGRRHRPRFDHRLRVRRPLLIGAARRRRPRTALLTLGGSAPGSGVLAFGLAAPWSGSPTLGGSVPGSGSPPSRRVPAGPCPGPAGGAACVRPASPHARRVRSATPLRSTSPAGRAAGRLCVATARAPRAAAHFPDGLARCLAGADLPQWRFRRQRGRIVATGTTAGRDQRAGGEQRGEPSHVSPSHPAQKRRGTACPPPVHARLRLHAGRFAPGLRFVPLPVRGIGSLLSCPARWLAPTT
jgi:hypothetical protein